MALYEYQCNTCSHRFEIIQRFSDPPPASCPKCGGPVRKLLSSPAFQFKGSGWYVTDYARKAESSKAGGEGESEEEPRKDAKEPSTKEPSTKESTAKEAAAKESGGKDSGGKDSGGKESGGKESAAKESTGAPSSTPTKSS